MNDSFNLSFFRLCQAVAICIEYLEVINSIGKSYSIYIIKSFKTCTAVTMAPDLLIAHYRSQWLHPYCLVVCSVHRVR